jgi:hypothetical protein
MENKKCTKCLETKPLDMFAKKNTNHWCKNCQNIYTREYYSNNRDKILKNNKKYAIENKHKQKEYHIKYHQKNKDRKREYSKEYYIKNKESIIKKTMAYTKSKRNVCPVFSLKERIRRRISEALKSNNHKKEGMSIQYLGCTWLELKEHLECQFKPGMSWENRKEWHVDHIIPLALFDLTDLEQQKTAFHVTNLQPLWAKDNLKKGGK